MGVESQIPRASTKQPINYFWNNFLNSFKYSGPSDEEHNVSNKHLSQKVRSMKPKMIAMIGGPGAGKSFVRKQKYEGVKVLDCDSIKSEHPDYDPKNPALVHEWSSKECTKRIFKAISEGETFVYDGTGTNVEKYVNFFNQARLAGYEIEVCYVKCSLETAIARNQNRERTVPEDMLREKHSTVAIAFEILSSYADEVRVVNNN